MTVVDRDFQPTHTATAQGLSDFLHEASSILEEVGMTIMTAKEETGSGRTWVTLVSSPPLAFCLSARLAHAGRQIQTQRM